MIGDKKLIEELRTRYLDSKRLDEADISQLQSGRNKHQIQLVDCFVASLEDDRITEAERHNFRKLGVFHTTAESFDKSWTAWAKTHVANAEGQELIELTEQAVAINNLETSLVVFSDLPSMLSEDFATIKTVIKNYAQQCVALCQEVNTKSAVFPQLLAQTLSSSILSDLTPEQSRDLGMIVVNALKQLPPKNSGAALLELTKFYYGDNDHIVSSSAAAILLQQNRQEAIKALFINNTMGEQTIAGAIALSHAELLPEEVGLLLKIFKAPEQWEEIKGYVMIALGNLPAQTTAEQRDNIKDELLVFLTNSPDPKQQIQALQTLGQIGIETDYVFLKPYFFNSNSKVQIASIDAWANIQTRTTNVFFDTKQDIPKTLGRLATSSSADISVRQHALSALIAEYRTAAFPTLLTCLSDQNPEMRSYAKNKLFSMAHETFNAYSDAATFENNKSYEQRKLADLERLKTRFNLAIRALQKTKRLSEAQSFALTSLKEALDILNDVEVPQTAHK